MTTETTDPGQQPNPGETAVDPAASAEAVQTQEAATAEGKGEGQAAAAGDKPTDDGPKDEAQQGAPEAYTEFTVPEGYKLEGERLEQTQALFKELGLSQDKAQKLIERYCSVDTENAANLAAASEAARAQQIDAWGQQAKAELGDKYESTVASARLAVQTFGDEAATEAFDTLGWGNHPALIRLLGKAGAMLGENPMETGKQGGHTAERSAAEVLFDHPTSKHAR